jgi:hypothetical protein
MAALRHQSSLEGVIDFGSQEPVFANPEQRTRAVARFNDVIGHFAAIETNKPYNHAALIRLTFEYARSAKSQDRFLAFFFQSLAIGPVDGEVPYSDPDLGEAFYGVAEFLMNNFFLPCRYSYVYPPSVGSRLTSLQCAPLPTRHRSPLPPTTGPFARCSPRRSSSGWMISPGRPSVSRPSVRIASSVIATVASSHVPSTMTRA